MKKILIGVMALCAIATVLVYRDRGTTLQVVAQVRQPKSAPVQVEEKPVQQQKVTLSLSIEPSFKP